jgi:hypothetical protein
VRRTFRPAAARHYNPGNFGLARFAVSWAGVEVVLHMRSQLVATRQQVGELAEIVRRGQRERRGPE